MSSKGFVQFLGVCATALAVTAAVPIPYASVETDCDPEDSPSSFRMSLSGVYYCTYREQNQYATSGYYSRVVLWNRNDYAIRFRLTVAAGGERRVWNGLLEAGDHTHGYSIDGRYISMVVVDNVERREGT